MRNGILFGVLFGVIAAVAGMPGVAPAQSISAQPLPKAFLRVVDPFLLGAGNLRNLDLPPLVAKVRGWSTVAAKGLAADGGSAAIVLVQSTASADVRLATTDGTSLLPYRNDFLVPHGAIAGGSRRLTVSASQLFKIGPFFYAAALLQGPVGGAAANSARAVTVTAIQGSTRLQASIDLAPPPLILVHGLWGDASSLQQVKDYLTTRPPWAQRPELVQAIQYENDLPFDSPIVAAALNTAIRNDLLLLDSEHIVGGRVDLVAHSMGGLVARHFALSPAFRQPRNRMQGQFHQIVTLDTPETGSQLATFLFDHRGCTEQRPNPVWIAACGLDPSTTVEECFAAIGMPLGPPGHPKAGAVYSLEPNGPHLRILNSDPQSGPNIRDVTWRAVAATKPSNSLEAFENNGLIAAATNLGASRAACPRSPSIPTVDTILGGPNDAIVAVTSQRTGAAPSQFVQFRGLSHSPANPLGKLLDPQGSDANVVESAQVDRLVACWLREDGDPGCKAAAQAPAIAAAPTAPIRVRYAGRLTIALPQNPQLGTPLDLTIALPSPGLSRLVIGQSDDLGHHAAQQTGVIAHVAGNTVQARVVPALLGRVRFEVRASFADGGLASGNVMATVRAPATPPTVFRGDANWRIFSLDPSDPGGLDFAELHPQAVYAAAPDIKIDLDGRVRCSVVPAAGAPVVELYDGCWFRALRPGTAMIEVQFGSAADRIEVVAKHE